METVLNRFKAGVVMGVAGLLFAAGSAVACPPEGETSSASDGAVAVANVKIVHPSISQVKGSRLSIQPVALTFDVDDQPDSNGSAKKKTARVKVITDTDADTVDQPEHVVVVQNDQSFSVRMENGKITSFEHNGKSVPLDRVKKDGGSIRVLDEKGNTLETFKLNDNGPKQIEMFAPVQLKGKAMGSNGLTTFVAEAPKAMIGVQLAEPDRSLLGHFGLKSGEAALVSGVYEDLPASKAGLEPYDIIIAVDGKSPAGEETVRGALREKGEDDTVKLTVIHHGEKRDIQVKLVGYDAEKIEKSKLHQVEQDTLTTAWPTNGSMFAPSLGALRGLTTTQDPEQVKLMIENMKGDAEQWRQKAEKMMLDQRDNFKDAQGTKDRKVYKLTDEGAAPLSPPPAPGQDARWQQLENRLDRLEKMIEKLAERRKSGGMIGG